MSMISELQELGADVNDAMQRFMNNASLYERMLKKLPATVKDKPVMEFIESGDIKTAIENAHTLKGVMGNLSVSPLYKAYTDIVNLLREDKPGEAKSILEGCIPVQEQVMACIEKYN
ncbi:MAG: hypothetical protein HDR24_07855 [Lachnospiraceae bacterium]|nr:hypothetical protein [Lachnospiraceae bacterium]